MVTLIKNCFQCLHVHVTENVVISPFSHRAELLSWCGTWEEVLPVLPGAKEGCRCPGINMFSTISSIHHEIFIKLDFFINTQPIVHNPHCQCLLHFIAVLLPGTFPWWPPGFHHKPTHPQRGDEDDAAAKRGIYTHLDWRITILGCTYVQSASRGT